MSERAPVERDAAWCEFRWTCPTCGLGHALADHPRREQDQQFCSGTGEGHEDVRMTLVVTPLYASPPAPVEGDACELGAGAVDTSRPPRPADWFDEDEQGFGHRYYLAWGGLLGDMIDALDEDVAYQLKVTYWRCRWTTPEELADEDVLCDLFGDWENADTSVVYEPARAGDEGAHCYVALIPSEAREPTGGKAPDGPTASEDDGGLAVEQVILELRTHAQRERGRREVAERVVAIVRKHDAEAAASALAPVDVPTGTRVTDGTPAAVVLALQHARGLADQALRKHGHALRVDALRRIAMFAPGALAAAEGTPAPAPTGGREAREPDWQEIVYAAMERAHAPLSGRRHVAAAVARRVREVLSKTDTPEGSR